MLTDATAGTAMAMMPMMMARIPAHMRLLADSRSESVPMDGLPSYRG